MWSSALNVSGQGGSGSAAARAGGAGGRAGGTVGGASGSRQPAGEEHYVELRFSAETKRRYKPGLPFTGKVSSKYFYHTPFNSIMFISERDEYLILHC